MVSAADRARGNPRRWVKAALGTTAGVIVIGLAAAIVTRDPGTSTLGGVDIE